MRKKLLCPEGKKCNIKIMKQFDWLFYIRLKKPSNKELLAPWSSRKCKSLTIGNVAMQLIEVSKDHSFGEKKFKINGSSLIVNLVKLENSNVFDGFSTQNAQVG